jgi:hypothetical protein
MNLIVDSLTNNTSQLMFPICEKCYYNTACNYRKKDTTKDDSEYALAQSWDIVE